MRQTVILLTCVLLSISFPGWGANSDKDFLITQPHAPIEPPKPTEKLAWIDNMQKELPVLLCNKDHYFIQCFTTTPKECLDFTQVLVRACLNNVSLALPPQLSVEQGEYSGKMIARCAYDLYEKFMEKKKKDLNSCRLPDAASDSKPEPQPAPTLKGAK